MHRLDKQMRLRSRSLITAISLLAVALSAPFSSAHAQDKTSNHTMPSGPDVWRVELRNYNQFTGRDSPVNGERYEEIHSIKVTLENRFSATREDVNSQFHSIQETAPNMASPVGVGNKAYVRKRWWDTISWTRQPKKGNNLWIHTRQFADEQSGKPVVFFAITVETRELDCVRQRVCNRGNNGKLTFLFSVPVPTKRSSFCIPQNSFYLNTVIKEAGEVWKGHLDLTAKSDASNVQQIPFAMQRSRPELFVKKAEICIASTSK